MSVEGVQLARKLRGRRGVFAGRRLADGTGVPRPRWSRGHRGRARTINFPDTVGYPTAGGICPASSHTLRDGASDIRRAVIMSCIATTTWDWRWPTRWRRSSAAPARWNARSTASGERAGNCSLEEVVMAIRTRTDIFKSPRGSIPKKLPDLAAGQLAHRACTCSGTRPSSARTPSPTRRASTRTAMLNHRTTYEIMEPEDLGIAESRNWCWASTPGGTP